MRVATSCRNASEAPWQRCRFHESSPAGDYLERPAMGATVAVADAVVACEPAIIRLQAGWGAL